ncbi:hypothetical protein GCM10027416_25860 [Okibacterium endophyticum]
MTLDTLTIMVMSGLVIVTIGLIFVMNTLLGNNDLTGRLWSMCFILAMLAVLALASWALQPDAQWVLPVANASLVGSIGAVWAGARSFNSRTSMLVLPLASAVAAGVISAFELPLLGEWAGGGATYGAIALFAALGAIECGRGLLGRRVNGRVMLAVLATAAIFYGARFVLFIVAGPHSDAFSRYVGEQATAVVVTVLIVVIAVAMSILRAERGHGASTWRRSGVSTFSMGVLEWRAFVMGAGDRVDRVVAHHGESALIVGHLDNLPEINLAFGRQFGDEAIAGFAASLRAELPPTSIIGHRSGGRFVIVMNVVTADQAKEHAVRVLGALVDRPIDSRGGFRLSASFGVADSFETPHDFTSLLQAAEQACDEATRAGGNRVVVAGSSAPRP